MAIKKTFINWSGGKDCSLALYRIMQSKDYEIKSLLTTVSQKYQRISMHGVRISLLEAQVDRIGLPLKKIFMPEEPSLNTYNKLMYHALSDLRKNDINTAVFGDIYLEDLRTYREKQLKSAGLNAIFPLWKTSTKQLASDFIQSGFKAIVVCIDESKLGKSFTGRDFNQTFINELPENIDPCGENGEFHTFVYDGPIFKKPVNFKKGDIVYRTYKSPKKTKDEMGFWFCDLQVS